MCIYCDKLISTKPSDHGRLFIEEIISEDQFGHRIFKLCKWDNSEYDLEYESDDECFCMQINNCPMCGRKLE